MGISEILKENVVRPELFSVQSNGVAIIHDIDEHHNQADIYYVSNNVNSNSIIRNVPIKTDGCGLHSSFFKVGDMVNVSYLGGSKMQPIIIGKYDHIYYGNTRQKEYHIKQGDLINTVERMDGEIPPAIELIKDENNTSYSKSFDFKDARCNQAIAEYLDMQGRFTGSCIGLFHEDNKGIIKISNDGNINIFTGFNTGIRVNADKRTIETFGDVSTISQNWTVISNNVNIQSEVLDIKSNKIIINGAEINV